MASVPAVTEGLREKYIDSLLLEAPQSVPASCFGMDDPAREAAFIVKLKRDKRLKQIDSFGKLPLFKAGNTIFSEDDKGLLYFVKYVDVHYAVVPGRHVIQIAVWRRAGNPPGISGYVFWQHLFPIHGVIMTDAQQMQEGRMFWRDRSQEAWDRNLLVYRVNLVQHKHDLIRNLQDYILRHQQERLLITHKPL